MTEEQFSQQTEWLSMLAGGMNQTREAAAEMGAGFMAMGEMVNMAGDAGAVGMGLLVDGVIAAARGTKGAYAEMGKAMLKWAADNMKSLAMTAVGKATFYAAEAIALSINPLTMHLVPAALAASGAYWSLATYAGAAAVGIGLVSAANAPSGSYYSQDQRDSMTGVGGGSSAGGSRTASKISPSGCSMRSTWGSRTRVRSTPSCTSNSPRDNCW